MKLKLTVLLLVILSLSTSAAPKRTPAEIINRVAANFLKLKDAETEVRLDYRLYLFGCASHRVLKGNGFFKGPDKIKTTIDGVTYFAKGNSIRKIDQKGRKFYVRLINAVDAGVGFHPGLITHNFNLRTIKDSAEEIIIEGIPKPGILNNTEKIIFYIDPKEYLLSKFHAVLYNKYLSGTTEIDYEKIKGIWVPVGCHGKTAIQLKDYALIGVGFSLRGKNIKINTGLKDKLFEPGF